MFKVPLHTLPWVALCVVYTGPLVRPCKGDTCVGWKLRQAIPWGVADHAMVYDENRGVIVRFGGTVSGFTFGHGIGETWEWNGAAWQLRSTAGPMPRYNHAMAYDSVRRVTVLFGGYDIDVEQLGDTWEWNGSTWTQRSSTGPTPRYGCRMVFDAARGVTVLFGGRGQSSSLGDTWEWNGTSWMLAAATGPGVRYNHAMAYDRVRSVAVLFGGNNPGGGGTLGDTWEWNGSSWSLRSAAGPPPRYSSSLAYDALRQVSVLFSGYGTSGLWEWDGVQWSFRGDGVVPPRQKHAAVYDSVRGAVVLYGGFNGGLLSDTWRWDGTVWTPVGEIGPAPRGSHTMAYDSIRNVTILEGGYGATIMGETWEWDGTHWAYRHPFGSGKEHAMVFDDHRNVAVLVTRFGTYEWDGTNWALRTETGPVGVQGHALAYDSFRGVTVLNVYSDTWEWDGITWVQRTEPGPATSRDHGMAFDETRGVTVMHGIGATYDETWEWDGTTWVGPLAAGPTSPGFGAMTFDTTRGVILVTAGNTTWDWDGASWTYRGRTNGLPSYSQRIVYDRARGVAVLNTDGETWESYVLDYSTVPPAPTAVQFVPCACYAPTNRYLSFIPPGVAECGPSVALRVTLGPMPGPSDCPKVADYRAFDNVPMWVGTEVLTGGGVPTGIYQLQATPLFRDWATVEGGVIHLSDCNIVPCAGYTVDAVTEIGMELNAFSPPLVLSTTATWGDIVSHSYGPGEGMVDAIDVVAMVARFKDLPGSPLGTWCDLFGNRPTQGVNFNIDALDIVLVVDAFKGFNYPFPGPTAPDPCP